MSQTILVFEEDCILAAVGKEGKQPVLLKARRLLLRGQGDAFQRWQQALEGLEQEWKQEPVRLVLPANLCASRVLTLPFGKGRQLESMAVRELQDSFRNETADYSELFSEKKNCIDICAGGVEAANLESFLEICQAAGFSVGGMTVPMEGYLRVLRQLPAYWNRTAIYLFFEEDSMLSVLGQDGRYVYSSRSRLFSEPGTLDFGTEIVRSISGIMQFSGNKQNLKITEVYYAGCPADDFEVSASGIQSLNLKVFPMEAGAGVTLPGGMKAQDWLPCIGALISRGRKEKRINLYQVLKASSEKEEKQQGIWKHFLVPAAVLLVCLGLAGAAFGFQLRAQQKVRRHQDWIDDPLNQQEYREALTLKARISKLDQSLTELAKTERNLEGYPEFSSSMLRKIESIGGGGMSLRIVGYNSGTGVLNFDAVSGEVIDIPSYIQSLKNTGLFHSVDYTGYTFENEWYTLSLSGTLEGNAIEEPEKDTSRETKEGGTP